MPPAQPPADADSERGLYLGRFLDDEKGKLLDKLVYARERHMIFFGPSGSGKGVRFLMPNLLGDYLKGRSIVVIDPKGELASVCAGCRHWMEGGRRGSVKILDPFGKLREVVGDSARHEYLVRHDLIDSQGFNPLDALDPQSELFYDDAAAIGEALIQVQGNEPHWAESAQGLVTGLVMWEVVHKRRLRQRPSLSNVRAMLTEAELTGPLVDRNGQPMLDPEGKPLLGPVRGLRATARQMVSGGGPQIASLAGRFLDRSREIDSIRSTADTQTRWLLSERIVSDLDKPGGIDFRELRREPTTVFVILPAERMRTHSVWLRLVVVSVLRALYRTSGLRTVLMIDELAALGHLGPLEDAFGLVRGYNVQIVGMLQDLTQLQALYKERWESFLANAGVVQGFAPNDLTTADWMSRRSGQKTVRVINASEGASGSLGSLKRSWNRGTSTALTARAHYLPHDLFGFTEGSGVLWIANEGDTIRFFADLYADLGVYAERAMPNPYYNP